MFIWLGIGALAWARTALPRGLRRRALEPPCPAALRLPVEGAQERKKYCSGSNNSVPPGEGWGLSSHGVPAHQRQSRGGWGEGGDLGLRMPSSGRHVEINQVAHVRKLTRWNPVADAILARKYAPWECEWGGIFPGYGCDPNQETCPLGVAVGMGAS